ncbi:ATP-grasp domain-containing protein [Streptomyces sp. EN27]|uniref:ATP-grasp domain-containing protein n=1 Tax=Streptomyces sp. EN27 TaxID=211464 RepID=UPI000AD6D0D4|nr:ATP-grasp domain-containing protein [Streptomyces sp. EN27]
MSDRPLVALVYQRPGMPWMFEGAERAGVDVVLIHRPDPRPDEALPAELPPAVVRALPLDIFGDEAGSLAALEELHRERPLAALVTALDVAVPFTAKAARSLGLPGLSEDASVAVRDKREMRRRIEKAGLNTPAYAALSSPEDWKLAADLDFPVVVKPAGGFTSLGVTRVDSRDDLEDAVSSVWEVCSRHLGYGKDSAAFEGLVVEEYLDGDEYCVESLSYGGETRIHTIGYKGRPEGPYFEETVYRAPAPLTPAVERSITEQVTAAHRALGVTDGPTHAELRLRGDKAYLLEMGARVGASGGSHHIVESVTGVDFAGETFRIAMGREPVSWSRPVVRPGVGAMYFVPVGGSGRIADIEGLTEAADDPRVDRVIQLLHPGDRVLPYPEYSGYPGFVLSHHGDYPDAERFHQGLDASVSVTYE